ncbi:hypothetical protein ACFX2G_015225 [Malus domestica]
MGVPISSQKPCNRLKEKEKQAYLCKVQSLGFCESLLCWKSLRESYRRRETQSPQTSAMPTVDVGLDLRRRVAETPRIIKLAETPSCRDAEFQVETQ